MEFSVYLMFNGNCEEAMNFYKDALGAEMKMMQRFGESPVPHEPANKDKILHCGIEKDGFMIMASDTGGKQTMQFGDNMSISLSFNSQEEIDSAFAAISAGGNVTMPLEDTFWGARFGMCIDKFGIPWMFNWDKPKA